MKALTSRIVFLLASLAMSAAVTAAPIQLTFTGSYLSIPNNPADPNSVPTYSDQGSLPFAEPADGTTLVMSMTLDPTIGVVGTFNGSFPATSSSLVLGTSIFNAVDTTLTIFNDIPTVSLPPNTLQGAGTYVDGWIAVGNLSNGHHFSVNFLTGSDTSPTGTLDDANFIIPGIGEFDYAFIRYEGSSSAEFMLTEITSVNASVPVPAAAWLFGSAILGTFGLRTGRKAL